ncbi:chromosome segregation protein SMC [Pectinatus brassicae]|uniref:Chromosome partition protein Smc n=1 Tax=Pectinatus brassicae TaxID=862415 RepID=A0A840UP64_9FIRM|nr:chromosome segregation protein SMC [Pectinatus brassicae]MBB5336002.1 chromosome segregation protein [Pectinatus brassicae]
MLLKRLEAFGFKSFADRIEIEFDKGITSIVGPNGSGKSNVTDAIRWVLGEQNIRSLRGNKAEDIIFTGSSLRKPAGAAEVSLTFDNTDGKLPLEFQEITITRRLFRSGESEFYINKARCRLKDIYTLFADTGLGKDSISVISQNKVDDILNAKPENRRLLFEECAGITKYRDRKKEAMRKLESTKQNAIRINDIIGEIEKQLTPLQEEAKKTREFNELKAQYDKYKLSYILAIFEKFSAAEKDITEALQKLQQDNDNSDINIETLDSKISTSENNIALTEQNLNNVEQNNRKLTQEIERNRSKCTVLEERVKQNSHSLNSLKTNYEVSLQEKTAANENLQNLQQDITKLQQQKIADEKALEETNTAIGNLEKNIKQQENILTELKNQSVQKIQAVNDKERQIALIDHDITEKTRLLKQRQADGLQLATNIKELKLKITASQDALNTLIDQQKTAADQLIQDKQRHISLQEEHHLLQVNGNELNQNIDRVNERVKILNNMQKAYEGFGKGVKKVLTASEQLWHKDICGSIAELIKVESDYTTAIEIALGASMQNIVTTNDIAAKQAIAYLKKEKAGRVTFLPLTTVKAKNNRPQITINSQGFINFADRLVQTADKYQPIIQSLLGRTIVVDTIDNALLLAKQHNYTLRIVTLGGEILHAGGAISGGSIRREISFLNRENEIRELEIKNQQTISQLLRNKTQQGQILSSINKIEDNIDKANDLLQKNSLLTAQQKISLQHLQEKLTELDNSVKSLNYSSNNIQEEIIKLQTSQATAEEELLTLQAKNIHEQDNSAQITAKINEYTLQQKDLQKSLLQQTAQFAAVEQTLSGNKEKKDLLQNEYNRSSAALENNKLEQARLQITIDESLNELNELKISSQNLQQLNQTGREEYDNIYKLLMDKRVQHKEYLSQRKELTDKVNKLQENIHQLDLKATKITFELEQCEKQLQEQYNLSPQAAANFKEDLPEDLLAKNIKQMDMELKQIGDINPNAIKEYDALNERYQFMNTQIQDLKTARIDLEHIIEQMDVTMAKQFQEAFTTIQGYFNDIFMKLFGGGQAKLLLTDSDDVLNAGVDIMVQPPGKKNQNLALLSGGERTLTVIALLFAFLQYSPAPFSVLDEIDAPLDEANIGRFGIFLQDYALNTQFIIVTHRKKTMETADVMYGITIQEAGVSKVVSVKMEDTEENE